MHSFREVLTDTTKITENISESPTITIFFFFASVNVNFRRRQSLTTCVMTEKSEL